MKDLLRSGMRPEEAGQRVMREVEEYQRELHSDLAGAVLMDEAECRRPVGE